MGNHAAFLFDHLCQDGEQVIHHRVVVGTHSGSHLTGAHLAHVQRGCTACVEYGQVNAPEVCDACSHHLGCGIGILGIRSQRQTLPAALPDVTGQ
ncbi:MAG: hypothetical protein FD135_3552 [Comamonadaceae bacterium]|nr:MAG: hypothetical protein FD135_3552 [Comamonadaceae bacterium]